MSLIENARAAVAAQAALDSQTQATPPSLKVRVIRACQDGERNQVLPPRQVLLAEALQITSHDRNSAYGEPEDNFENIAAYWRSYCQQRFKVALDITAQDVAHFMILMKVARVATNAQHRDSLVDIAGYAACAADCQEATVQRNLPI